MKSLERKRATPSARASLVVATSNTGKLRELKALIGRGATLVPLSDLGIGLPEETGSTFDDNARAKASLVASATGMLTIADDSGLEVDALNGEPGVRSARFAGPHATDEENRKFLLERMRDIPACQRFARFVCVIAIADAAGNMTTTTGMREGSISMQETGTGGFGYDPIFLLQDGRTMAELTPMEKNSVSHRGVALRRLMPILLRSLPDGMLRPNSQAGEENGQ